MNYNGCLSYFILLLNLLSGVKYLYVCYTPAPDSFKAPGQPGACPVRTNTGIRLRALRLCFKYPPIYLKDCNKCTRYSNNLNKCHWQKKQSWKLITSNKNKQNMSNNVTTTYFQELISPQKRLHTIVAAFCLYKKTQLRQIFNRYLVPWILSKCNKIISTSA